MGRKKGSKNHKGEKPWVKYGLTESAYYYRMRCGIPFDAKLNRGRKKDKELAEALETFGKLPRTSRLGRASGRKYENPPEKIEELKEKYKNGITSEIWEEFVSSF